MLVVGAQRQQRAAAAPIVPAGALGASAWLRRRHGAGRPGRGHVEGLALLAGPAPGWSGSRACLLVLRCCWVSLAALRQRARP